MAESRQAANMGLNKTCELCLKYSSSIYCMCTGVKIFLCDDCLGPHKRKNPTIPHMPMAIEFEGVDANAYQERMAAFGAGKTELEANLTKIDKSCQDLSEAVDSLIASLVQHRDYWVGQLQAWKLVLAEDIHQAISEVQSSITNEQVYLAGKYSAFLRNYQPGNLVLFNYRIDSSSITRGLESLFTTEYPQPKELPSQAIPVSHPAVKPLQAPQAPQQPIAEPPRPVERQAMEERKEISVPMLCTLTNTSINLFNFQRCEWSDAVKLDSEIPCDEGTSYAIDNGIVFFFGRERGTDKQSEGVAGKVSRKGSAFVVERFPNMKEGRCEAGGIVVDGSLWIFGGIVFGPSYGVLDSELTTLNSAEVLSLKGSPSWTQLPRMSEDKVRVTPVLWRGKLYLSGSKNIDIFDLTSRSINPVLPLQLPEERYTGCVATLCSDELVIVTSTRFLKVNLASSSLTTSHEKKIIEATTCPVVFGEHFYWISGTKCKRASLPQPAQIEEF